ncbi:hypothetical protein [Halobacterium wangiae]|uniref:hypothetical protein n=1 Tax=Halobacterium wangiae TaxID=2902623 RepID=UPI001E601EBB|nr:hypothetical protein [Halobacterium wangiae]
MTAGRLRVVFACALLLFAGCTAPTADSPVLEATDEPSVDETTTTDERPEQSVQVVEGDLDVDANQTFERVETLVEGDYPGTRVVVRDLTSYKTADYGQVPFFRVFGVSNPDLDTDDPAGLTTLDARVYLSPAEAGPARLEQVLAHEFVHVAQVREEMVPWFGGLSLGRVSLDERFARRALVEGGAVYVTDDYTREHLPNLTLQSEHIAQRYAAGSSGDRVVYGQYRFGFEYVNATIDDPADLAAVYDDAPRTTENVLHPGDTDDPAPLDVTTESEEFERVQSPTGRVGELVTRITLRDATGEDRAVNASEGWGNDRVVVFEEDWERSIAWVTRWDTSADADEFAAAARTLGNETDTEAFRTTRLDDETVVVFAGSESFVETASASGNVTISA